jgi:hypothetical protein
VSADELAINLEKMFDNYLVFHGYTSYMRDYEMIVLQAGEEISGKKEYLRFLFRFCVTGAVKSTLGPHVWRTSTDDSLLDIEYAELNSSGYVWGVKNQEIYPGARLIPGSPTAARWSDDLGIEFHEVEIVANAQSINLVFADLAVDEIGEGYSPFTIR